MDGLVLALYAAMKFNVTIFQALEKTREILTKNAYLLENKLIQTESEQLVIAAYREATGTLLSRADILLGAGNQEFPGLEAFNKLITMAEARARGKLLQHITGVQFFYRHEYEVGPGVLIPRPETEILIDTALTHLNTRNISGCNLQLGFEIGLGSGILSIELIKNSHAYSLIAPDGFRMLASELAPEAEAQARGNAAKILGQSAARLITLRAGNVLEVWQPFERFFDGVPVEKADFLISNPPYLQKSRTEVDDDVYAQEPSNALFAPEEDLLYFYRIIVNRAREFIRQDGFVFLEIPHERAIAIQNLFIIAGWTVKLIPDFHGRNRVLVAS